MSYITWLRGQVGHRRVIMVFATVVLYDERGHVLLQRRTDFDIWGLPGGILEPGESIQTCARRELLEETGLMAGDLRLVGVYADPCYDSVYPNGDQVQQYTVCFAARANGGQMQPDGVETSAQAFFAQDEIPYSELPNFYQDMLRDALAGGGPHYALPACRPELVDNIKLLRAHVGQGLIVAPGAIAVVVDQQDRVLMGRRSDDGAWSLPGGYMHLGENDAYTALRETREETGLEVAIERMLGVYSPETAWLYPNGDQAQAVISCFLAHPTGGQLRPDGSETSQVAWMSLAEILALDVHPNLARLHQMVAEHLSGRDSGN
ncbi:MAG: NUDIX domain-containing protein [Chloroflexota bacterium]